MTDRGPALDELTSERDRPAAGRTTRSAWVRRGLAAAALVAAAAVLGPSLLSGGDEPDPPRREPTASPGPTSAPPPTEPPLSALRWTLRGDLAGDAAFTAAALAVVQAVDPTVERVLYAGTLPDHSRIVLVGAGDQDSSGLAFRGAGMQALHVPAGAAPSAGRISFAGHVASPDDIAGWAGRARNGEVVAVLLGRPVPLDAQVSTTIDYSDDGRVGRSWQPARGRDGSAIVELGHDTDPLVVARTTSDEPTEPLLMAVDGDLTPKTRSAVAAKVRIGGLDSSYRGPARRDLPFAVVDGAWTLLDPRRADIRVAWSGRIRGRQRGALLVLRRPDGPTFQLFVLDGDDGYAYPQGVRHVPWGEADQVPWILQTGQPGTPLTLVNPSGAGTVVIEPPGGQEPRRVRIGANGLANLGGDQAVDAHELSGAQITVLSPKGREVATTEWSESDNFDPFALESP